MIDRPAVRDGGPGSVLAVYGAAVAAALVVTAAKLVFAPYLGRDAPFALFGLGILAAGWLGGPRSAAAATFLLVVSSVFFFLPPFGSWSLAGPGVSLQLGSMMAEGAFITAIVAAMYRTRLQKDRAALRAQRLQALTAGLASARSAAEVSDVVIGQAVALLGPATGALALPRDDGKLELVAHQGQSQATLHDFGVFSPDDALPAARAFRTGSVEWIEDAVTFARRYPAVASREVRGKAGMISLPLISNGRVIGATTYRFDEPRRFSEADRDLLQTFASLAAQALDRTLTAERAAAFRGRLEALNDLGAALSAALTHEDVATVVVQRGMATMSADTCTLYVVDDQDGSLELIGESGVAPEISRLIQRIARDSSNPVVATLATAQPLWAEDDRAYRALFPALAAMKTEAPRARAFWSVPLCVEGRAIGLLGMGFYRERRFSEEERAFIQTFTAQCAQALRRAQLYSAEQRARRIADGANRSKDEFLATVSHELRTPLTAILGWARLMARGGMDDARRAKAVDTIERNAVAMAQLVEDLLDISRIISGRLRLDVQPVELPRVIQAAVDSIKPAIDAKSLSLQLDEAPDLATVVGDPMRLQQVMWNLLSNAAKFTPKGGRIQVGVRREESWLVVNVSDTGKGIDPGFLPHVFDPFRQADSSIRRAHGGLGLGLAISRQLVELHGGSIAVDSEGEGRGATFRVTLPISVLQAEATGAPRAVREREVSQASFEAPPQLRGLRVLVVDDETDARQLVRAILESCQAVVREAPSVAEAIAAFADELPDVVISDIGLPGQDGFVLISKIRALPAAAGGGVPVVALTAFTRAEDRLAVLKAGFNLHLPKPVDPAELVAVIAGLAPTRIPAA